MADARLFQALSDPTRLKIMSLLAGGPMNVSSMVARLGCAQPAVSRHLRVLRDVALIRDKRKGKEVEYSVNLVQLGDAAGYLGDLFASAEIAAVEGPAAVTQPARSGKQDRPGIRARRGGGASTTSVKPAVVKPALRRAGVEGRPPLPETGDVDVVVGWAQQPRPRPPAKAEVGAQMQARPPSGGEAGVKAKGGARADGEPGGGVKPRAGASTRHAAASDKAAKAGRATPKPRPRVKPKPRPKVKPKPQPKPKPRPKPKPPAEPEYIIERDDDAMDDFLL